MTAVLLMVLGIASCDGGLGPAPEQKAGFEGTIRFVRTSWPPADSIFGLWVFTSQEYLSDSTAIFTGLFTTPPTIYLYPGLTGSLSLAPMDSVTYVLYPVAGTYAYTGVIQQTSPAISAGNLRIVGLYRKPVPGFIAETLSVRPAEFIGGVDIAVDFNNPPPQPY